MWFWFSIKYFHFISTADITVKIIVGGWVQSIDFVKTQCVDDLQLQLVSSRCERRQGVSDACWRATIETLCSASSGVISAVLMRNTAHCGANAARRVLRVVSRRSVDSVGDMRKQKHWPIFCGSAAKVFFSSFLVQVCRSVYASVWKPRANPVTTDDPLWHGTDRSPFIKPALIGHSHGELTRFAATLFRWNGVSWELQMQF